MHAFVTSVKVKTDTPLHIATFTDLPPTMIKGRQILDSELCVCAQLGRVPATFAQRIIEGKVARSETW